ncbi:hypothetical protein CI610_01862 [invertebrate metagenome]|uniref:Uncharacterized protein n=1 Tax=invertebrate metagenome TaxID=1711999 RepID=A0A2H9T7G7_9ZZZZ
MISAACLLLKVYAGQHGEKRLLEHQASCHKKAKHSDSSSRWNAIKDMFSEHRYQFVYKTWLSHFGVKRHHTSLCYQSMDNTDSKLFPEYEPIALKRTIRKTLIDQESLSLREIGLLACEDSVRALVSNPSDPDVITVLTGKTIQLMAVDS